MRLYTIERPSQTITKMSLDLDKMPFPEGMRPGCITTISGTRLHYGMSGTYQYTAWMRPDGSCCYIVKQPDYSSNSRRLNLPIGTYEMDAEHFKAELARFRKAGLRG